MPCLSLFPTVKTAALYLVPIKSYSKNTHASFIFKWAIVTMSSSVNMTQQAILNLIHHIVDPNQYDLIKSLLFKFQSTFDTTNYTIAKTKVFHTIETYPHVPPVSISYSSTPTSISDMRSIINKLLARGLVCKVQAMQNSSENFLPFFYIFR
jgi:hypothetical protein